MADVLFYTLVVLLPIAFYTGFRVGKKAQHVYDNHNHSGISRRYLVGLNYLLNEEPDKAIDALQKVLEVDTETVEPFLALGNLYRKRGEVDRAIRIHQNLIAQFIFGFFNRKKTGPTSLPTFPEIFYSPHFLTSLYLLYVHNLESGCSLE